MPCASIRLDALSPDLFWEGTGPTDVSDRIHTSMPSFITKQIGKRLTKEVAEADK